MDKGYDEKCHDLATYFLPELQVDSPAIKDLAQTIQDAVEDWFAAQTLPSETPAFDAREAAIKLRTASGWTALLFEDQVNAVTQALERAYAAGQAERAGAPGEDYPGQNYFHAHNPNIKQADLDARAERAAGQSKVPDSDSIDK